VKSVVFSRVPEPDLIALFIGPLEDAGIDSYMISGSVASIQFGEPRVTLDVDVAISMTAEEAQRLPHIYPTPAYYCPPVEILTGPTGKVVPVQVSRSGMAEPRTVAPLE